MNIRFVCDNIVQCRYNGFSGFPYRLHCFLCRRRSFAIHLFPGRMGEFTHSSDLRCESVDDRRRERVKRGLARPFTHTFQGPKCAGVCANGVAFCRWKIEPFKTIHVRLPRTDERCGKTRSIVNRPSVKSYLEINRWPLRKVNINYSVVVRVQMRSFRLCVPSFCETDTFLRHPFPAVLLGRNFLRALFN